MISSVLANARRLARAAMALIVATLAALLVLGVKPDAAVAVPSPAAAAYAYDGFARTSHPNDTTNERGPPAKYDRLAIDHALDRRANGALPRLNPGRASGTATYTFPATRAFIARATATTREQAQVADGPVFIFQHSSVAAETGTVADGRATIHGAKRRTQACA